MFEPSGVLPTDPDRTEFSALVRLVPAPGARRVIVALRGQVDAAAVPALTRLRAQLVRCNAPVTVITSRVTFMDSTGLAAVLALGPPARRPSCAPPTTPSG